MTATSRSYFDAWYSLLPTEAEVCPYQALDVPQCGSAGSPARHHRRPLADAIDHLDRSLGIRWRFSEGPPGAELVRARDLGVWP